MVDVRIAGYDPFLYAIFTVLCIGYVFIPLYPRRKDIGKENYNHHRYYDEGEEFEEQIEAKYWNAAKGRGCKNFIECIPQTKDNDLWWCQRLRVCYPVNHLLWFRIYYALALGICFSIQVKYYFQQFGDQTGLAGEQTNNQMWASLAVGISLGFFLAVPLCLNDFGFALGAWVTIMVFVLNVWAPSLQSGLSVMVICLTALVMLVALGFCIFWSVCAGVCCFACCFQNTCSHLVATFMIKLQMGIVQAIAMTWCLYIPWYGVSHFETHDKDWTYQCMWTAVLILAIHMIYSFCCCQPEGSCIGGCLDRCGCACCAHCYQSWEDPNLHTVVHKIVEPTEKQKRRMTVGPIIEVPKRGPNSDTPQVARFEVGCDEDDEYDENEEIAHAYPIDHTELKRILRTTGVSSEDV